MVLIMRNEKLFEEEWDFSPAPVQQILQQARNQALGIPDAFPDAMIQRLQQVIRQPLAVESNGPSSAGPDEAANDSHVPTTSNDSQAPPTSTNDDDDDLPDLGEGIPDSDDEDDDSTPRGSGRYNLRSQVKEPQRYIPQSFMSFPGMDPVEETEEIIHARASQSKSDNLPVEYDVNLKISLKSICVPKCFKEAFESEQWPYWHQAMIEEMDSVNAHSTFEYVHKDGHIRVIPLI